MWHTPYTFNFIARAFKESSLALKDLATTEWEESHTAKPKNG
jgi:hypothetical protein